MTQHIANVIGIDPGFSGGIAVVSPEFDLIAVHPIPIIKTKASTAIDATALANLIDATRCRTAYIEFVVSRPRQANQFTFGLNTGVIHGVVQCLGLTLHTVSAPRWKAGVGLGRSAPDQTTSETKARSRALAARIWPLYADRFAKANADGLAEAALIALYGTGLENEKETT